MDPVRILDFVLFQLVWFACVLGAARARPEWGVAATALYVAFSLARARAGSGARVREAALIVLVTAVGTLADGALQRARWIDYGGGTPLLAPAWIAALWAALAVTSGRALGWLAPRLGLAAVLGALVSPLSYSAGERLGALELARPLPSTLLVFAATWAVLLPALFLARRALGLAPGTPVPAPEPG